MNQTSIKEIKEMLGLRQPHFKKIINPTPSRDYYYRIEGRPFDLFTYWQLQEMGVSNDKITHKIHRREVR